MVASSPHSCLPAATTLFAEESVLLRDGESPRTESTRTQRPASAALRLLARQRGEPEGTGQASATIEWVYRRAGQPVEVIDEYETWRRIRDWEGTLGWVHQSMLQNRRNVRAAAEEQLLRRAEPDARPVARSRPARSAATKLPGQLVPDRFRRDRGWLRGKPSMASIPTRRSSEPGDVGLALPNDVWGSPTFGPSQAPLSTPGAKGSSRRCSRSAGNFLKAPSMVRFRAGRFRLRTASGACHPVREAGGLHPAHSRGRAMNDPLFRRSPLQRAHASAPELERQQR